MTRLLTTTILAGLIAVPAMAQSGVTGPSPTAVPSPPAAAMPLVAPIAPQIQTARPPEDWQSAVHEYGDAGIAPLPSEVGVGGPPTELTAPRIPPYSDAGGGD